MEKENKRLLPSEEMRWKQFYTPQVEESLKDEMPRVTLWKFMEDKMLKDGDEHDAVVYFGNHIKRSTFVENVHHWARVLKGMGLKPGDEILLLAPAFPESIYVLLAADMIGVVTVMPNLFSSDEMVQAAVCDARVAFVFEGMEQKLTKALLKDQFEYVVVMSVDRSMGLATKLLVEAISMVKYHKVRYRHPKYMTMAKALRRFGNYKGELEDAPVAHGKPNMIFASSGTTMVSQAKLVGMSDEALVNMFNNALAFNQINHPFTDGATAYCYLPPFALTAFFILMLAPLYTNMTVFLDPRLSLDLFTKSVFSVKPQITLVPGGLWEGFFENVKELIAQGKKPDLSFLRMPIMGGEGCTPESLREMNNLLRECGSPASLSCGYGMTEVGSVATVDYRPDNFDKKSDLKAISVGYPFPGVTVGIFDKDGKELSYGERGEVWIKSPTAMMGYYGNEELTRQTLRDGWMHSSDMGEIDENGLVYIYGRMKQHIDAPNGEPVYMFDIANDLRQDAAIKDSLASIINGDVKNPRIVVHLIKEPDCQESDIQVLTRMEQMMKDTLPKGVNIAGYQFHKGHFRMRLAGKVDRMHYEQVYDGYVLPVNGELKDVSF